VFGRPEQGGRPPESKLSAMRPLIARLAPALALLGAVVVAPFATASMHSTRSGAAAAVPRFSHVVEVMLENESATSTFENPDKAPHLHALLRRGVYLPNFYAEGHVSLDNYLASFGGVEPNIHGETDCSGQPDGTCIYPSTVPTLGALLDNAHKKWRVYSEGMTGAPGGHNCLHAPSRLAPDVYQGPLTNGYAARHNPAVWFDSVLSKGTNESYCRAHSVDLTELWKDARSSRTMPAWSFVEPDTCHDGHDIQYLGGCTLDPEGPTAPNGVAAIEAWLPSFVDRLTASAAWDARSLLVITFDEGSIFDTDSCTRCHDGSAGGRIGTLLIGPVLAHPGTTVKSWYGDHYSLLRTWERAWHLPSLKSKAVSPAAAAKVHDGDPGVKPLTGIWQD